MKNGNFKYLTLFSFIVVLIIVVADTTICARKDISQKSKKISSVVSKDTTNSTDNKKTLKKSIKSKENKILNSSGTKIKTRFNTPAGYKRSVSENSFGEFLENYPLYSDGRKIRLYNGKLSSTQNVHAAVLKMNMTDGDLQQCADSVIRLTQSITINRKNIIR